VTARDVTQPALPWELAIAPNPRTHQVVLWLAGAPYALTVDQARIVRGLLSAAIGTADDAETTDAAAGGPERGVE
jgi:hypothetical protein